MNICLFHSQNENDSSVPNSVSWVSGNFICHENVNGQLTHGFALLRSNDICVIPGDFACSEGKCLGLLIDDPSTPLYFE